MAPPSVNELPKCDSASFERHTELGSCRDESLPAAGACNSCPPEIEIAPASDHRPPPGPQPPVPDRLAIEPSARVGEASRESDIPEAELKSLLADAHNADAWSDLRAPGVAQGRTRASPPPSSALADHAAGIGQARPAGDDIKPGSPPPDIETAAAKVPERQLSQASTDALLARLEGG